MKLLLDTHLILWAAIAESWGVSEGGLSAEAAELIRDESNALMFSAVSIWEVAIKRNLDRRDFRFDPHRLRNALFDNDYEELPVTGAHSAAVAGLPDLHKDPFDRLLVAQATVEGVTLLTSDATMAQYPGPIRKV